MNKVFLAAVGWSLLGAFSTGCKVGKKPTRKHTEVIAPAVNPVADSASAVVVPPPDAPSNTAKALLIDSLAPLYERQLVFTTFNGKAKMHFESGDQKNDFTANFRIEKDKTIWISVAALGGIVNVARVLVTPDSVKAVNYLQKEAYVMPISGVSKLLPAAVDFQALQDFVIGQPLLKSGKATDATSFGGSWSVQMNTDSLIQQLTYNKADSSLRTSQLRSIQENGLAVLINYGNYIGTPERRFSSSRAVNITNGGVQQYLEMNFTDNPVWDQPIETPFSIPTKYTMK